MKFSTAVLSCFAIIFSVDLQGDAYNNRHLLSKSKGFYVLVQHQNGISKIWVEPQKLFRLNIRSEI